ncbi:hypothetical protein GDO81_024352 [Engystomops pustulosus]|uniref:Uncharacterized protein n=1 Tax=Engystomops pustulosus TaxID=76066 RepID=A0AAV6YKR3_ENGPU|nr:hypothetical protein GDO81_024352 [Engystomops pustulosus]
MGPPQITKTRGPMGSQLPQSDPSLLRESNGADSRNDCPAPSISKELTDIADCGARQLPSASLRCPLRLLGPHWTPHFRDLWGSQ